MQKILKYNFTILGVISGAILGFIYSVKVGCSSGGCATTSSPVNSALYGALMLGLLFNIFQKNES